MAQNQTRRFVRDASGLACIRWPRSLPRDHSYTGVDMFRFAWPFKERTETASLPILGVGEKLADIGTRVTLRTERSS
jgi:hypothetical protein